MSEAGQVAYEAYCVATGGKSAVSGAALPTWDEQREDIRAAWRAAADGVLMWRGPGYAAWTAPEAGRYRFTWPWTEPVRLDGPGERLDPGETRMEQVRPGRHHGHDASGPDGCQGACEA